MSVPHKLLIKLLKLILNCINLTRNDFWIASSQLLNLYICWSFAKCKYTKFCILYAGYIIDLFSLVIIQSKSFVSYFSRSSHRVFSFFQSRYLTTAICRPEWYFYGVNQQYWWNRWGRSLSPENSGICC